MKKIDFKQVSGMFSLSTRDFLRSALLSAIAPGLVELIVYFNQGTTPHFDDVKRLSLQALGIFLTSISIKYLSPNKNLKLPDEVKN